MKRLAAMVVVGLAPLARGQVILSNFAAAAGAGTTLGPGSVYQAAGWTMPRAYDLQQVKLTLDFAGAGEAEVSIWEGVGAPLVQLAVLSGPPGLGSGDFLFKPSSPVRLQPGHTYWVRVRSAEKASGTFEWKGTDPAMLPMGTGTNPVFVSGGVPSAVRNRLDITTCYANCDGSTTAPIINVADFTCFLQRYAAADEWARCDLCLPPTTPHCNDFQFGCFLTYFAAGCP
jgi:hypothetical protein